MSIIVTLTGPSAAGKSTLERLLVQTGHFARIISHTTRAPRHGETDRDTYYFISREEFIRLADAGEFVETVEYNDNLYGAAKSEFTSAFASGKIPVIVVEPHGKHAIEKAASEMGVRVHSVFVDGPLQSILHRLTERFLADHSRAGQRDYRVVEAFVSRLEKVMTTERGWCADAYADIHLYDQTIFDFGPMTQTAHVHAILAALNLHAAPVAEPNAQYDTAVSA